MSLDPRLVEILACPEDKGPLLYFPSDGFFYNPRLRRRYEVTDGIPIMLIDEATTLGDESHAQVMARAAEAGIEENFTP
jgi:uncharacterized protein YbaR (Trm112 family)